MKKYRIRITMLDGSVGVHHGLYANGFDAILTALEHFPDAQCISAMRMAP